ncbi:MAG: hypothetical protein K6F51_01310 [Acetatifactor sp.]|nr:hypothetical protein [Acetatifactor sp.]
MSKIAFSLIFMFIIAIIIILLSIYAYNKRLDKIAKGELRDAHSNVPEPAATAGVTYKAVLIALSIVAILSISRANGMIDSLNNTINNMKGTQHEMNMEILELQRQVAQSEKLVSNLSWQISGQDMEKKTVDLFFSVDLKQYSDLTRVTLALKDKEILLTKSTPGTFTGTLTTDLFASYDELKVCITEGNLTKVESEEFSHYLFWDVLPLPSLACSGESKDSFGKIKYNGWFSFQYQAPDKLEKVTVTYVADGKDVKTFDATSEAKTGARIDLDKDITVEKNLAIRTTVITTYGYRIETQNVITYKAEPDCMGEDYERIYDANGNLVWNNEKYE